MWQKPDKNPKTKYHILVEDNGDQVTGACGLLMHKRPGLQKEQFDIHYDMRCRNCSRILTVVCTSVSDARSSLAFETDVEQVRKMLAYAVASDRGVTLIKMLERKIKQLENGGG